MAFPTGSFTQFLQTSGIPHLWDEFTSLYASLQGYLGREHKADGSHKAVTADSLATTGAASVGGALSVAGIFTQNGRLVHNATHDASINSVLTEWGNGGEMNFAPIVRVTSTTGLGPKLMGILEPAIVGGSFYWVVNATNGSFDVIHASPLASSPRYRIICPGGVDMTVRTGGGFGIFYDNTSAVWRVVGAAL